MNHQADGIEEFLQVEMIIRCNLNRYMLTFSKTSAFCVFMSIFSFNIISIDYGLNLMIKTIQKYT